MVHAVNAVAFWLRLKLSSAVFCVAMFLLNFLRGDPSVFSCKNANRPHVERGKKIEKMVKYCTFCCIVFLPCY